MGWTAGRCCPVSNKGGPRLLLVESQGKPKVFTPVHKKTIRPHSGRCTQAWVQYPKKHMFCLNYVAGMAEEQRRKLYTKWQKDLKLYSVEDQFDRNVPVNERFDRKRAQRFVQVGYRGSSSRQRGNLQRVIFKLNVRANIFWNNRGLDDAPIRAGMRWRCQPILDIAGEGEHEWCPVSMGANTGVIRQIIGREHF